MECRGVTTGGQRGHNSPGAESQQGCRITAREEKSPNSVTCAFFNTVHCFRKTSGSNIGAQTSFSPRAPSNLVTPLIECLVRTIYHGTLRLFNSFLISLNLEKDLSPEQLVTIKLRNKASRGCIN